MLSWTQLNPTVKISDTKKKFYKKYLHKAVIYMPGGRLLYDKCAGEWESILEERIIQMEKYFSMNATTVRFGNTWFNTKSSWYHRFSEMLKRDARADQYQYWYDMKTKFSDLIHVRVEEPSLTVYCNDLNLLYQLVSGNYPSRLREIVTPKNEYVASRLDHGDVLLKTIVGYDYKIVLKETKIDLDKKQQLLDYLYNLGDDVKLTRGLIRNLGTSYTWFTGGYFYAKDEKIVTFIQLIAPNIIAEINKILLADQ